MAATWTLILFVLGISLLSLYQTNNANELPSSWDECLPTSKVIGGEPINITEAPFVLGLEIRYRGSLYRFGCGAIILTKKVALTAAHCIRRLRSASSKRGQGNMHYTRKVVKHPTSAGRPNDDDIALLFVKQHFEFSDSARPIKLPTKELETGTLALTVGYGRTYVKPRPNNVIKIGDLRRVALPIIDRETCSHVVEKKLEDLLNISIPNVITKTMVCAGYPAGKYDACQGDSGGPLYYEGTLYGVVSWGVGCALPCSPGIYANVYRYLNWINELIQDDIED